MTIFDALENPNAKAFLKALRLGEGTADDLGYRRIVGGDIFDDMSQHPNRRVWITKYQVWSTAAGAYQIIYPTWKNLVKQYGFKDFTSNSQDAAAVALIKGRCALDDVIAGHFFDAIKKCSAEWASLPGSTAGQRIEKMDAIKAL